MERHSARRNTTHRRRLAMAVLVIASTSGCATQSGPRLAEQTPQAAAPIVLASRATANRAHSPQIPQPEPDRPELLAVRPAGHTDAVMLASPVSIAQSPQDASERRLDQLLELDPPREDAESGGESGEKDDERLPPEIEADGVDELDVDELDLDGK